MGSFTHGKEAFCPKSVVFDRIKRNFNLQKDDAFSDDKTTKSLDLTKFFRPRNGLIAHKYGVANKKITGIAKRFVQENNQMIMSKNLIHAEKAFENNLENTNKNKTNSKVVSQNFKIADDNICRGSNIQENKIVSGTGKNLPESIKDEFQNFKVLKSRSLAGADKQLIFKSDLIENANNFSANDPLLHKENEQKSQICLPEKTNNSISSLSTAIENSCNDIFLEAFDNIQNQCSLLAKALMKSEIQKEKLVKENLFIKSRNDALKTMNLKIHSSFNDLFSNLKTLRKENSNIKSQNDQYKQELSVLKNEICNFKKFHLEINEKINYLHNMINKINQQSVIDNKLKVFECDIYKKENNCSLIQKIGSEFEIFGNKSLNHLTDTLNKHSEKHITLLLSSINKIIEEQVVKYQKNNFTENYIRNSFEKIVHDLVSPLKLYNDQELTKLNQKVDILVARFCNIEKHNFVLKERLNEAFILQHTINKSKKSLEMKYLLFLRQVNHNADQLHATMKLANLYDQDQIYKLHKISNDLADFKKKLYDISTKMDDKTDIFIQNIVEIKALLKDLQITHQFLKTIKPPIANKSAVFTDTKLSHNLKEVDDFEELLSSEQSFKKVLLLGNSNLKSVLSSPERIQRLPSRNTQAYNNKNEDLILSEKDDFLESTGENLVNETQTKFKPSKFQQKISKLPLNRSKKKIKLYQPATRKLEKALLQSNFEILSNQRKLKIKKSIIKFPDTNRESNVSAELNANSSENSSKMLETALTSKFSKRKSNKSLKKKETSEF
ncbi:hypothetical protein QEN19_001599 [Hanseniaspora menglaensis]